MTARTRSTTTRIRTATPSTSSTATAATSRWPRGWVRTRTGSRSTGRASSRGAASSRGPACGSTTASSPRWQRRIQPLITLNHWDYPLWVYQPGRLGQPAHRRRLRRMTKVIATALPPRCPLLADVQRGVLLRVHRGRQPPAERRPGRADAREPDPRPQEGLRDHPPRAAHGPWSSATTPGRAAGRLRASRPTRSSRRSASSWTTSRSTTTTRPTTRPRRSCSSRRARLEHPARPLRDVHGAALDAPRLPQTAASSSARTACRPTNGAATPRTGSRRQESLRDTRVLGPARPPGRRARHRLPLLEPHRQLRVGQLRRPLRPLHRRCAHRSEPRRRPTAAVPVYRTIIRRRGAARRLRAARATDPADCETEGWPRRTAPCAARPPRAGRGRLEALRLPQIGVVSMSSSALRPASSAQARRPPTAHSVARRGTSGPTGCAAGPVHPSRAGASPGRGPSPHTVRRTAPPLVASASDSEHRR